jgi:DNA-binding transcriptional ArsR family regulator
MVKYRSDPLSEIFRALADPTRRAILAALAHGDATVGELAAPFDMSLPAVSKHLSVLEGAGLLHRRRNGRMRLCRLDPRPMREAACWIEDCRRFWDTQLDRLERYLSETESDPQHREE